MRVVLVRKESRDYNSNGTGHIGISIPKTIKSLFSKTLDRWARNPTEKIAVFINNNVLIFIITYLQRSI